MSAPTARYHLAPMDIQEIARRAVEFAPVLEAKKREAKQSHFEWYPWPIVPDVVMVLEKLLTGDNRDLLALAEGGPIADIGGADGDLAYFLETLGCEVDIIDHAVTSGSGLLAAMALKEALGSSVGIYDVDVDAHFQLPRRYSLVFFTGILYHLKNPFYALEALARTTKHCVLSTKTATYAGDARILGVKRPIRIADLPIAYLLEERELNDDPTNYWVFSHTGLRLLLKRAGWQVIDYLQAGNVGRSYANRSDEERDWCLLRSNVVGHGSIDR
jgi:hypothetical protein